MAESDHVKSTIEAYVEAWRSNDRSGWLDLFTDDAVLIDPVGSPPNQGKEAITVFWDRVHTLPMQYEPQVERIVVCEDEAMLLFRMVSRTESGGGMGVNIVDTFVVNGDGKITELKAYWDSSCMSAVKPS